MPARTPEEVDRCLAEAFRAKDLEAILALYEPGATFIAQPGQPVTGLAAIRVAIQELLSIKPHLQLEVTRVLQAGDIALLSSTWTLTGTTPEGNALTMSGNGMEVVRRQSDGTWRYVIDDPYAVT